MNQSTSTPLGVCQNQTAKGAAQITITMFCQITMVLAESVRASALEIRFEAEKIGVETRMQITPRWIAPKPGRMMIMAPAKPTRTAIQRRSRTSSCRNSAAPMVTKIGPVKPSAVISASVVSGSATNHNIMPAVWMAPREMCRPSRLVWSDG